MMTYLAYPKEETGYGFEVSHAAVHSWLNRIAQLPGWGPAYGLLPGKRLERYL